MANAPRSRWRHLLVPLVLLAAILFVAGGTYVALTGFDAARRTGECTAAGLGTTHSYTTERTANAALISAVAVDRGLPPRAASIALATAYQESKLQNIDYGDRDSVGLFQQRPSQDWGTAEQIMDPVYASNAFYDVLVTLDYESMEVNDAAQKVQRSGYPEAYADHETEGRIFASALTGQSGGNLVCDLEPASGPVNPQNLQAVLERQFSRSIGAGTITSSLSGTGAALGDGTAPEGAGATALVIDPHGDTARGWALANWAVAQAGDGGVVQVRYQGQAWTRADAEQTAGTWPAAPGGDPGVIVVVVAGG